MVYTIHGLRESAKGYPFECGSTFNQEISDEKSRFVQTACEDFFRSNIFSRSPPIQKLMLAIWDTPQTLENSISSFLNRSELSVSPAKKLVSEAEILKRRRDQENLDRRKPRVGHSRFRASQEFKDKNQRKCDDRLLQEH